MPGTRSSVRLADQSSPSSENTNGTKRKAESSPTSANSKRGRKDTEKDQKTIEETFAQDHDKDEPKDIEMKEAGSAGEGNNPKPDKQEEAKVESKTTRAEAYPWSKLISKRWPQVYQWLK